ncbi:ethylmalonyl-CoA decarboxylase-like [Ylistrum balloti]|uniref:ethylmalonyl-CoA decarboxylase-like n=1 Tax=Ylistrum balloti TaxID=509963 RepID=UPI002905F767|nr:ethylmalonyl-CoA decarboxylase-like [Ylistrum balloti]
MTYHQPRTLYFNTLRLISSKCNIHGAENILRCPQVKRKTLRCLQGCLPYFTSSTNMTSFRSRLEGYGGGSVDLTKDVADGIAIVTLNNPDKKNALSGKMMLDFRNVVEELETWDDGKGVILTGSQRTFCSGGDLTTVQNILTSEQGYEMAEFMHETLTRLHRLPLVSMALVQGNAIGGGAELTTACDFRVMTNTARIGFVQMKMGVLTGWGGATRLVGLVGRSRALDILCSSRLLSSQECLRQGLIDHIIPLQPPKEESIEEDEVTLRIGRAWLSQYCHADVNLVRDMKTVVIEACESDYISSLEKERAIFSKTWGGPAQKRALDLNIKHS